MTVIKHRRGTAAAWAAANPVLAEGEPAYETDTGLQKIGNGVTVWTGLPYVIDSTLLDTEVASAVDAALEDDGPGSTAGYASVITNQTFTSITAPGVVIPGLAITVVGNGRPMEISLSIPNVKHSVANTGVLFQALCDTSLGPLSMFGMLTLPDVAAKPQFYKQSREVTVADGVSKTWTVYGYADTAGTTTMLAHQSYPIELKAIRR